MTAHWRGCLIEIIKQEESDFISYDVSIAATGHQLLAGFTRVENESSEMIFARLKARIPELLGQSRIKSPSMYEGRE